MYKSSNGLNTFNNMPNLFNCGKGSGQGEAEGGKPGEEAETDAVHDRPTDAGT